jgi:hypothetical protein
MSTDAVVGLIGAALGSAASLGGVVLSQYFRDKNDKRKYLLATEEAAITQVYSPLVFLLNKTREIFVGIIALEKTLKDHPELKGKDKLTPYVVQYYVAKKAALFPKAFEDLLSQKAALMEPTLFFDLLTFQSYLETTCRFLDALVIPSLNEPPKLQTMLKSFGPIIKELDSAIGKMRIYAGKKVIRQKPSYELFFKQETIDNLEKYVEAINVAITGIAIPDWDKTLENLHDDETKP